MSVNQSTQWNSIQLAPCQVWRRRFCRQPPAGHVNLKNMTTNEDKQTCTVMVIEMPIAFSELWPSSLCSFLFSFFCEERSSEKAWSWPLLSIMDDDRSQVDENLLLLPFRDEIWKVWTMRRRKKEVADQKEKWCSARTYPRIRTVFENRSTCLILLHIQYRLFQRIHINPWPRKYKYDNWQVEVVFSNMRHLW